MENAEKQVESQLYHDVCFLIENTRQRLATTVNAEVCIMHWQIGRLIKEDVLYNKRAEYGKQIVKNLAGRLTERYGRGWGYEKLKHCVRSAYPIDMDTPRRRPRPIPNLVPKAQTILRRRGQPLRLKAVASHRTP